MDNSELKQIYPRIVQLHPRMNLQSIHEIKVYVEGEVRGGNRDVTARNIFRGIKTLAKSVVDRSLRLLVKTNYIKVAKGGRSRLFLSEERKNGSFGNAHFDRESIGSAVEENFTKVLDISKSKPELFDSSHKGDLKKIHSSMRSSKQNFNSYNKIVDFLWTRGYNNLVKLSLKNTANRYTV